jgi:hypothetical protein
MSGRHEMRCRNCGLPRAAHKPTVGERGQRVWSCPNGSGSTYPATLDVKVELHYDAGEDHPWIAKWVHPRTGAGEVASDHPVDALERAGHAIEADQEEKTGEELAIEAAIK